MIQKRIVSIYLPILSVFCIFLIALAACQSDEDWRAPLNNKNNLSFQLLFTDSPQTRADISTTHEISYFVADSSGKILNFLSDYHPEDKTIVMEPLPNGNYQLLALTFDKRLYDYGFEVSTGQLTVNDIWFSFKDGPIPVIPNLFAFYGKIDFTVKDQSVVTIPIPMHNVFAAVYMEVQNSNNYIKTSTKSFTISTQQRVRMHNQFTLSGEYTGSTEWDCDDVPIEDETVLVTMPQIDREPVNLTINLTTLDYKQHSYHNKFTASCTLGTNQWSTVSVDLSKHPDARMGMIYASRSNYDSQVRPLILQDSESKKIYHDANQRSFYINAPLQLKLNAEGLLHTRFYSPCAIKEVGIWAQLPGTLEQVQLAYYDSIPAFCDATFPLQLSDNGSEFPTSSGGRIVLTKNQVLELAQKLIIQCDDPFWIKVKQIRVRWYIRFNSHGTDPDLPNGGYGMNGDWKGIRPVHAREGIAIMFNVGYMITLPDFVEWQNTFQGRLYGNGGPSDILQVSKIIPRMEAHRGFDIGLVAGSLGLGGGETWGVAQYVFTGHYTNSYDAHTIFHEVGHCIGFNHGSSMTYGKWAQGCCDLFYAANIKRFPVNSYLILNSRNNQNIYR